MTPEEQAIAIAGLNVARDGLTAGAAATERLSEVTADGAKGNQAGLDRNAVANERIAAASERQADATEMTVIEIKLQTETVAQRAALAAATQAKETARQTAEDEFPTLIDERLAKDLPTVTIPIAEAKATQVATRVAIQHTGEIVPGEVDVRLPRLLDDRLPVLIEPIAQDALALAERTARQSSIDYQAAHPAKPGTRGPRGPAGADGVGPDERVKVNADDPEPGYLADKLKAGRNVALRVEDRRLVIDAIGVTPGMMSSGGGGGGGGPHPDLAAQTAAEVPFTPAGGIAATNVQAAIQELDTEKAALASAVMDGDAAGGDLSGTYPNPSVVNDSHSHGAGTAPGAGGELVGAAVVRTIAAGVVDVTDLHYVILEGEGAADDLLDEITGGVDGQFVVFECTAMTITIGFGTNTALVNQESNEIQLGNFVTQVFGVYSASDGNWMIWSNQQPRSIMSEDGGTEVLARSTGDSAGPALDFFIDGTQTYRLDDVGVGWFDKGNDGQTAPQQTAATLGSIYAALEAYGLLDAASGQPTPQTYTESNVTTDRTYNANATSIDELADVLGTLIADLRAQGLVA